MFDLYLFPYLENCGYFLWITSQNRSSETITVLIPPFSVRERLVALAASRNSSFGYCRSVAIVLLLLLLPLQDIQLQVLVLICFSVWLLTMKRFLCWWVLGFFLRETFLHHALTFHELVCELVFYREKNVLKQDSSSRVLNQILWGGLSVSKRN